MQQRFEKSVELNCPPRRAFEWHRGKGVVERLIPPWVRYGDLVRQGGLEEGATTSLTLKFGPLPVHWHSVHTSCVEGEAFTDRMVRGPFSFFEHTHRFEKGDNGGSLLIDRIQYRLPFGCLSDPLVGSFVRRDLARMFRYRHRITARDIASCMGGGDRKTIAVSGASGVIGTVLVPWLRSQGHRVLTLVRRKSMGAGEIAWDPSTNTIEEGKLQGCDVLIHLAGENIGNGRWTPEKRARIIQSRVDGTAFLARTASRLDGGPTLFMSASAVGFYGDCGAREVVESHPCGGAFISNVCGRWEQTAEANWTRPGGRLVTLRIGVVLTPSGGALARLLPVFKMGLGGTFGRGDQSMSWVSMEDVLGAIAHIMDNSAVSGPVNLTAPHPVTNRVFARTLAAGVNRCACATLPSAVVTCVFGAMGREVLLEGVHALPEVLLQSGYRFFHPTLAEALDEVL